MEIFAVAVESHDVIMTINVESIPTVHSEATPRSSQ
jgi:hypothetical protein